MSVEFLNMVPDIDADDVKVPVCVIFFFSAVFDAPDVKFRPCFPVLVLFPAHVCFVDRVDGIPVRLIPAVFHGEVLKIIIIEGIEPSCTGKKESKPDIGNDVFHVSFRQ